MGNQEVIKALKEAMKYVEGDECCLACTHYRKAIDGSPRCGGTAPDPKPQRCTFNVIDITVSEAGRCEHFQRPFAFPKATTSG